MKHKPAFFVLLLLACLVTACRKQPVVYPPAPGGPTGPGSGIGNKAPIANAGPDQTIYLPKDSIWLDGIQSGDVDGNLVSWKWNKIAGPISFQIKNDSLVYTVAKNLIPGTYQFELTVRDNGGLTAKDTMKAFVLDTISNHPPVSVAGLDTTIYLPASIVNLDGSRSSDPDNNITSYSWTKTFGPAAGVISNPNAVQTQAVGLTIGVYNFELKVTDAGGLFSKSTYLVRVAPPLPAACNPGTRPLMNAQLIPVATVPNVLHPNEADYEVIAAGNKLLFKSNSFHLSLPGQLYDPIYIYDLPSQTWTTGHLSKPRMVVGMIEYGGKVYFGPGGWNDTSTDTSYSTLDIYDASTGTWSVSSLTHPELTGYGAGYDNKIFFPTGNMVQIYNIITGQCTTAPLSQPRSYLSTVPAGNKVYFAGGFGEDIAGGLTVSDRVDVFDNATNQWSYFSLQEPKAFFPGISVGNKIYWAGGFYSYVGTGVKSPMVQIYDILTQTSTTACLFEPKAGFKAVVKNNKICFFIDSKDSPQNRFDIYDITTNEWSIGVLPVNVIFQTIVGHNNTIYAVGGIVNGQWTQQVYRLEF